MPLRTDSHAHISCFRRAPPLFKGTLWRHISRGGEVSGIIDERGPLTPTSGNGPTPARALRPKCRDGLQFGQAKLQLSCSGDLIGDTYNDSPLCSFFVDTDSAQSLSLECVEELRENV